MTDKQKKVVKAKANEANLCMDIVQDWIDMGLVTIEEIYQGVLRKMYA